MAPTAAAVEAPGLRYDIRVTLDPFRHRLTGEELVVYRSGADTALTAIFLHAYPNALSGPGTVYGRGADRAEDYRLHFIPASKRAWMRIDSVTAGGAPAAFHLDETVGRVDLPRPLPPGDSVAIRLRFAAQVPPPIARFEHVGRRFTVAQWYPKIAVYDERGWVCDPYAYTSEFYGDYGTFDVAITLPDGFWVDATGVASGVEGGDNEIPLADAVRPRDSVTVTVAVARADSLRDRWPSHGLRVVSDCGGAGGCGSLEARVGVHGRAVLRVPRGAPVHYRYEWDDGDGIREPADAEGRAGPLHLLLAERDTTLRDTLRVLAPVASPGDTVLPSLKTVHFHAERVHDFAWVAAPDYVRRDTTWSGIAVRALVFRDDQREWTGLLRMTVDALAHATARVGPYIWPRFTSAEAWCDEGSAMEYPMLTTNDPATRRPSAESLDPTVSHELFHNWFYGMLGNDERAHPWLDEGFTQWLEHDHIDRKYPRGLFRLARRFRWLAPVSDFQLHAESPYLARAWARDEEPMGLGADSFVNYATYGAAVYAKTACMLHTLRGVLGDSTFGAFLHAYYRRGLLRHPRPEDVLRAAEEVSGRDLGGFFDQWVRGTDRPDFALGPIRREREGGRHRATVRVRRRGGMVFPVPVEGRFADGTRETKWVTPLGRDTTVVFESRTGLTGAVIDPRHRIVEMNRLDNGSGFLPPMRAAPLFDFPTTDAMAFTFGPTIWQGRAEGARLGLWLRGSYLPSRDFPSGIRSLDAGASVGTRDGSVAWRIGGSRRWGALGARGGVRAEAVRDAGMLRAGLEAGNRAAARGRRHPYRTWGLGITYRDRSDLAPVDPRYWSPGRSLHATASLRIETIGVRHEESAVIEIAHGASAFRPPGDNAPDVQYDRVSISLSQTLRLLPTGSLRASWRTFAGSAWRRVPNELLFDVAEGSRLAAIREFYLNDRGPVRASGHALFEGGAGVRGYADRAVLGRLAWGAGVSLARSALPLVGALFLDAGRVEAGGLGESAPAPPASRLAGRTLLDAGVSLELGPLRVALPVWLNRPAPGESPWNLRWRATLTRGWLSG
ncbi:MAG TPA: M1 family metallopeptidase [Candidatus Eisenbacteria bacterium]